MILDTNAVSALFGGDTKLKTVLISAARHHLPVIVSGEYRFGLLGSKKNKDLERLLIILERESFVLNVDTETTKYYAAIRQRLRIAGTPIPENDIWIAALARQFNLPIVSKDRHFDMVEGLQRRGW